MPDANRKIVFLIDDNEWDLSIAEDMLKERYEVYTEKSGRSALERLSHGLVPHVILMDIKMPGMDGWELYRKIREIEELKKVPVAFFNSINEKIDVVHAHETGAAEFIMKPFEKEDILKKVRALLKK